jgi:hypothetical protein
MNLSLLESFALTRNKITYYNSKFDNSYEMGFPVNIDVVQAKIGSFEI